jgi:nitrate/nitrite-specific signal transduction histidine kinase
MRERAEAVGGQFEIRSRPGDGTRIVVEIGGAEAGEDRGEPKIER